MKFFRSSLAAAAFAAGLASLLSVAAPAHAQTPSEAEIRERLLADRAACERNRTGDALQNCLREAGAAAQAARQGKLSDDEEERFRQNALARCTPLPPEQREACRKRIEGAGTVRGSVEAGGLFRELRIIEQAPQPTTSPAPTPIAPSATPPTATSPTTTAPTTTIVPPTTTAPPVVAPAPVAPAAPAAGTLGRPTFTPVQPIVPGRAAPAPATAPAAPAAAPSAPTGAVPAVPSAAPTPPPASLQVSPPATPVLQVPVAPPAGTVQPSAPQPLLVVPGNAPPETAR